MKILNFYNIRFEDILYLLKSIFYPTNIIRRAERLKCLMNPGMNQGEEWSQHFVILMEWKLIMNIYMKRTGLFKKESY